VVAPAPPPPTEIPFSAPFVGRRQPTEAEREYGLTLEDVAVEALEAVGTH
jgi:hypothetical protein